jgi:DNA adenine methylase
MLPEILDRVQEWQIESSKAQHCIAYHDSPSTMFYLDPPYLPETRAKGSLKTYGDHEMTYEQHENLLQQIVGLAGKVLISGYDSKLYRQYLEVDSTWNRHTIDIANHAAGGAEKRRMLEILWSNY